MQRRDKLLSKGRILVCAGLLLVVFVVGAVWVHFAQAIVRQARLHGEGDVCGGEDGLLKWGMQNGVEAPKVAFGEFIYRESTQDENSSPSSPPSPPSSSSSSSALAPLASQMKTRRGMLATQPITRGEWVIKVPFRLTMSVNTALKSRVGHVIKELMDSGKWDDFDILTLHLLWENRNPPSIYFHYLCTLPEQFTTPIFWDKAAIRKATEKMPEVESWANARLENWINSYNSKFPLLFQKHPTLFPRQLYSLEYYLWGASAVLSRNWVTGREKEGKQNSHLLVPVADMINHAVDGGWVNIDWDNQFFYVIAGREYGPGDEIFLSYGEKCNAHLLLEYGFTLQENNTPC